ncbi:hypothetical protein CGCF415_v001591 [Colletotrichum fructicola]|uniref:Major facilitator superfamily transporter n=1 Tax=Colletotrichum fructicola (strain Nara gc5) TaxID=1213859 RepID=L2FD70_COLFN|nr:uncharacterized protein CGMCC3_g5145 [Colletotrichum fructicola]KAF4493122.1 hypothetical protein CGGC5_v000611 [Colletotrichum fructicola Nara gc5]KAI8285947.1 hypothetical protein K4K60_000849 [Colletotrichum sp. SAR11_57]KAE9579023.1 hypothetical protein CGMCC3_g5145 [Colletotrichum fructicola]KAF4904744.1 hypothetical protein CGCFRS4_v001048 [Colletotrichum fructicola]KAF4915295.1 hypothetical protein CGCF415_v001591 [Colletotrichum fructicola]
MGLFSNPLRSRENRGARLPKYEQLSPLRTKERLSNDDDDFYSDEDTDGYSTTSTSSPSARSSRNTSSSLSSAALMLPKRALATARRPRTHMYRLPNRIIRYLCFGLLTFMLVMIMSLARASHVENKMISEGKVEKKPDPPPVWESFGFLQRYYGGIRSVVPPTNYIPSYPRSEDETPLDQLDINTTATATSEDGIDDAVRRSVPKSKMFFDHPDSIFNTKPEKITECFVDKENKVRVPPIRYFDGRPQGFPQHVEGSYELLNLPENICYERFGRYGPYGFGYSVPAGGLGVGEHGEKEGSEAVWEQAAKVDWRKVDWADAQQRCYQSNSQRFKAMPPKVPMARGFYIDEPVQNATLVARDPLDNLEPTAKPVQDGKPEEKTESKPISEEPKKDDEKGARTAVVIRVWDEYNWREDDIMNVRSVISELALASGGRYDIHLLVQIKNDAAHPVFADHEVYERRIRERIPEEFRGLVTLWTETQMLSLYQGLFDLFTRGPDLPVHGVYRGLSMAMQYFAYQHPEYDYYWSWEMDIRYTGHYYDLFSKMEDWAKEQPRKGLWERNSRFYLPSVHGSWEDFRQMARVQSEMGTDGADNMWKNMPGAKSKDGKDPTQVSRAEKTIWGPERPLNEEDWFEIEKDPKPPTSYEKDKYKWGVGEEADLISFNPIFDPEGTTWLLSEDITGYNKNNRNERMPPRRAHIITASRMSRRLLMTMHRETAFKKHFAFPEMWPATVAFHHGYKAVFAPHPMYVDREWPTEYMAQVLNGGKNGASGGSRTAVFGQREHNLRGLSWFYNSGFAPNLYRRWLGLRVNNDGGEEFEKTEDTTKDGSSVGQMRGGEGRMCLPPMLIHPVKGVELPVEAIPEEDKENAVPESDPNA